MIEKIKSIINSHKEDFENKITTDIKISKFFHGRPDTNKKVLFFISNSDQPLCIFKIVRDSKFNNVIEREIAGMSAFPDIAPKLFFHGELNGLFYLCEEVVSGSPAGKSREKKLLPFITEFHKNSKKGKSIKINNLLNLFSGFSFKDDEYNFVHKNLLNRKNEIVYLSDQHGDCTYKNVIFNKNGKAILIDWENFGLRPIWGIDLIHYLSRIVFSGNAFLSKTEPQDFFVDEIWNYVERSNLDLDKKQIENIFFVDWFFEILQKDHPEVYDNVIIQMQKIWHL